MSGWQVLTWCATCASGVLAFLKLVANDIELGAHGLKLLEEHEWKAYKKRQTEMAGVGAGGVAEEAA